MKRKVLGLGLPFLKTVLVFWITTESYILTKLEWVSPKLDPKTGQGVMRFVVSNTDRKLKDELRANIPIKDALVVMLNIPLAVVGGVIALYVSGYNLSVSLAVGFIAVFGIATLNGVVLLSYARKPFVVLPLVYEMLAKK